MRHPDVPKDYQRLSRSTFGLAVVQAKATSADSEHIVSLFLSGQSGVDLIPRSSRPPSARNCDNTSFKSVRDQPTFRSKRCFIRESTTEITDS